MPSCNCTGACRTTGRCGSAANGVQRRAVLISTASLLAPAVAAPLPIPLGPAGVLYVLPGTYTVEDFSAEFIAELSAPAED